MGRANTLKNRLEHVLDSVSQVHWRDLTYYGKKWSTAIILSQMAGLWHRLTAGSLSYSRDEQRALLGRLANLFRDDLQHVRAGRYERALAETFPFAEYLRIAPSMLFEFPRIHQRRSAADCYDLPPYPEGAYPRYYTRNFHWQTDGWLSERSAKLYDPSVEFLFGGTADIMRRMLLPAVIEACDAVPSPRILDVACGTGSLLHQLRFERPDWTLFGVDLSPYYIAHAKRQLSDANAILRVANGEALPFDDNTFDAVTSVFLFHELPRDVRRRVLAEMTRVTKKGGLVAVLDSEQLSLGEDIGVFLNNFPKVYHEPYYKGYLRDDLRDVFEEVGLPRPQTQPHFVARSFHTHKST